MGSAASSVGSAASAAVTKTKKVASDVSRRISFGRAKSFTNKLLSHTAHVESVEEENHSNESPEEMEAEIQNEDPNHPMATTIISGYEGDNWDSGIDGQDLAGYDNATLLHHNPAESNLQSPLNSNRESESQETATTEDVFLERSDLGEPQRYLITIVEAEKITVSSGRFFFRLSAGKRGQESKKMVAGDQLVQGIIKEWTGNVKGINEEFYFEFADPDTWIQIELRHKKKKSEGDEILGETKLHMKVLTTSATEEWLSLSNQAGRVRIKAMKVGRTEEIKTDGDEQAVMRAFQKHAQQLESMMHLRCRVIQALDVPAMDDTGTSDPYVVLTCGATKKRTKVEMKTLTPKWHEDFDFFFPAGSIIPEMKVEMMDHDALSRDDFMGQAILSIGGLIDLKPKLEWVTLKAGERNIARLQLALSMEPRPADSESPLRERIAQWFSSEEALMSFWEELAGGASGKRSLALDLSATGELPPAVLKVGVLRARDLLAKDRNGKSDPYVRLSIGNDLVHAKRTEVRKKTLSPTWMQEFQFQITTSSRRDALMLECFDKDLFGTDDSLGRATIALDSLVPDREVREWYPLVSDSDEKNEGQVELTLLLTELVDAVTRDDSQLGPDRRRRSVEPVGPGHEVRGLRVLVTGGRGMPKMDSGPFGKCDPYLKLACEGQEFKTKVVKRTFTPTWNESFAFTIKNSLLAELRIECFDYDMIGEHDFVGALTLQIRELAVRRAEWFKLVHPENPSFNAEVFLTIEPRFDDVDPGLPEVQPKESMSDGNDPDMSAVLTIGIIAARGLEAMDSNGTSDPYVVVHVGSEKRKTKVIQKDLNPQWNEKFDILVTDVQGTLRLQVYDKDLIGSDDLIGETMIPLSTIVGKKLTQKWYTILNSSKVTGEVLISLRLPNPPGLAQPVTSDTPGPSPDGNIMDDSAEHVGTVVASHFCCPPHIRVYVAATLSDMARERQLLHETVAPSLRQFCESRNVIFITVDMRLGLVEESPSILNLCLHELDKCSIFLCFLADRYGTAFEDLKELTSSWPWLESFSGKSSIEIEIAAAIVIDPDKFRGRSFVYFRDNAYLDSLPGLIRGDYTESDAQYVLALEALKKRLKSITSLPILENYATPEDALQRTESDLRKCISQMYSKSVRQQILTVQRSSLLQYCREPVSYYYLDLDAAQRLNNYIAFDERCVLIVTGAEGAGKSSFLRTWFNLYETRRQPRVFLFPHFDLGMNGVESANGILRRILFEMKRQFSLDGSVPTNYIQIKRTFLRWLRMASSKGKLCFVIDGADGLDEPDDGIESFLECVPRTIPTALRLILSMETGSSTYDRVLKRLGYSKTIDIGVLSTAARRNICYQMLKRHSKTMEDLDPRILKHVGSRSPVFLRVSMDYFVKSSIFSPSASLLETNMSLLEHVEDLFNHEQSDLVEHVFACIGRSRRGLTDEEIMSVCGINRIQWARLSLCLKDMLVGFSALLNFHHNCLDEAINKRYLSTGEKQQKITNLLADFFEIRPMSFRKIEEFPWHLAGIARFSMQTAKPSSYRQIWSRLRDCLGNIDFFLEMYRDEFVSDLHDYWGSMSHVYNYVEEYCESMERYASSAACTGATDRIVPRWHIARCQTKLAEFFVDSGRFDDADKMYKRALDSWNASERRKKDEALVTLQYGEMILTWGKMLQAEEVLKKSVILLEEAFGFETKECAKALYLISESMRHQKKEAEGIHFCERAYQILSKFIWSDAKSYDLKSEGLFARCALNLGILNEIEGDTQTAITAYKQAVKSFEKILGNSHPSYCQALECLSNLCKSEGLLKEASENYQLLLPIKEEMSALGGSLGDVTSVQNNLAAIFVKLGDLSAAEAMYRKTIRMREQQYGHSHPSVARSLEMLANLCCEMGSLTDAAFLLQRALGIRERVFGKDSIEIAATLVHLSSVQCRKGQFRLGRDLFKRWIKIMVISLGVQHPTCIWALSWLDRWPEGAAPGTQMKKRTPGIAADDLPGGMMTVTVIRGRNLTAMDSGVSSDPYVVVQVGSQTKKTWPKLKTLNPEWNEKMEFKISPDDRINADIIFQCFDKDLLGHDDDMGRFTIPIREVPLMQALRQWHAFDDKSKSGEIEIEILLKENFGAQHGSSHLVYPTGSLLEQMEAKQKRDQERKRIKEEARLRAQEQLLKDQALKRIIDLEPPPSFLGSLEEQQDILEESNDNSKEAIDFVGEFHEGSDDGNVKYDEINGKPLIEDIHMGKLLSLDSPPENLGESVENVFPFNREPSASEESGPSALHFAAMKGKEDKLNLLLLQSADPNSVDGNGMTPLHYAAGEGHTGIAAILLDAGANIAAKDSDGDTPLHIALQEQQHEMLKFLISKGSTAINSSNNQGNTVLHLVAGNFEDQSELLKYLLLAGADPNISNIKGESALDLAETISDSILDHQHHNIICEHLGIKKSIPISISGEPLKPGVASRCWTLIEKGDISGILKMIQFGMDVNGRLDESGLTPLMLAIKLDKPNVVDILVSDEMGSDLKITTISGLTVLHYLAIFGTNEMIQPILKRNPDPNVADRKAFTPVHYACERGHLDIVTALVERCGADVLALTEDKQTPLHIAAKYGHGSVLDYLLSRVSLLRNFAFVTQEQGVSAAINSTDKFGNTCLHYLSSNDLNEDSVRAILELKANPVQVNRDGLNPIDVAKASNQQILYSLLSSAATEKLQAVDISKQMLMLCYNIQDGDLRKVLDIIVSDRVDVMSPVDEVGDTLLHTAAAAGQIEILKELVGLGAYVFATNSLGCTPLHAAAMQGKSDAVACLLSLKADPRANDSEGYTPMHYAAGEGHNECLKLLFDVEHCDDTLKTYQGLTVLHVAVAEGRLSTVQYLLQRNPRLAAIPDSDGVQAIDYARTSKLPNPDIVRILEAASSGSRTMVFVAMKSNESAGKRTY